MKISMRLVLVVWRCSKLTSLVTFLNVGMLRGKQKGDFSINNKNLSE
jgi:hypothetical protein